MRRVKGSYSRENITEVIIPVLVEIEIINKLGYFTTDNYCVNDTTIEFILKYFRSNITYLRERRVRYLGYIINLAAKAFLFGRNKDSFKDIYINSAVPVTTLEAEMAF
jgi:ribosome biogenesis protein Nip4